MPRHDRTSADGREEATIDARIKRRMLAFNARALLDQAAAPRRTTPTPTTEALWRARAMHMRARGYESRIPTAQGAAE